MNYSFILFGKDVRKLAYKSNCDSLTLADCHGNNSQYVQVAAVMIKDKIRCVIRKKDDYDFGEFYVVENFLGKDVLVKELDEDVCNAAYIFYALHCIDRLKDTPSRKIDDLEK